jgi:hypothetical protein
MNLLASRRVLNAMRPPVRASAAAVLALVCAAAPVAAQTRVVDEGSLTIARGGRPIGREDFSIKQTPGATGPIFVASAVVKYDDSSRRLAPALQADIGGAPLAYQVEVTSGTELEQKVSALVGRGRISQRTQTRRGEAAKEYVVSDGALVLDDDVFHQYYFLALRAADGTVPVVIPRRNTQVLMRVSALGSETIEIGDVRIEGRHLALSLAGAPDRHVWVDGSGRLLKVAIGDLVALRDEPPR